MRKQELSRLSSELDSWYREYPLQPVETHSTPHALLLLMMYHLLAIFVFRPFYRSDIVEAAVKCDEAADRIAVLLRVGLLGPIGMIMCADFQLFDERHGLHLIHHNASESGASRE